jgi:hypothetical protein
MKRNAISTVAASPVDAVEPSGPVAPSLWLGQSLFAAQTLVAQVEQWQRLRLSAYGDWAHLLDEARRDAERVRDVPDLMSVTAGFITSHWALALEHLGAHWSQWLEQQATLADHPWIATPPMAPPH